MMNIRVLFISLIILSNRSYAETVIPYHPLFITNNNGSILVQLARSTDGDKIEVLFYTPQPDKSIKLNNSFYLIDNRMPKGAYISDAGKLVTLDKMNSYGTGDNVIVVYNKDGKLVKNYSLKDIYDENNYSKFIETSSSFHWRCTEIKINIHSGNKLHIYDRIGGLLVVNMDSGHFSYKKQTEIICPKFP